MENKTFQLLENMYYEIQNRFDSMQDEMKSGFNRLDKKIEQEVARLENKIDDNHKAFMMDTSRV